MIKLRELVEPDSVSSVAFDVLRIVGGVGLRLALYGLAVAALCLGCVVNAMQLWTSPNTAFLILVALAFVSVLAGWALRRAANLKARVEQLEDVRFCSRPKGKSFYGPSVRVPPPGVGIFKDELPHIARGPK